MPFPLICCFHEIKLFSFWLKTMDYYSHAGILIEFLCALISLHWKVLGSQTHHHFSLTGPAQWVQRWLADEEGEYFTLLPSHRYSVLTECNASQIVSLGHNTITTDNTMYMYMYNYKKKEKEFSLTSIEMMVPVPRASSVT